jgi:hypothetical protein
MSVDEKTSIQALERAGATLPVRPDKVERREFNYLRHGTQVLIGNLNLATGTMVAPTIGGTRTEADFAAHIARTVATDPGGGWIFLCDQLNTHMSTSLVTWVAKQLGDDQDLGDKGKRGILKTMATRQAYLSDESHRIRFVYTPKHCSWLNPIEVWFSALARRVLRRGDFLSTADLKQKMTAYITYYNNNLAKPFKWSVVTNHDIREMIRKIGEVRMMGQGI